MLSIKDRIALGETPDFAGAHWQDIVEPLQPFLVDVVSHMEEQVAQFDPEIAAYTSTPFPIRANICGRCCWRWPETPWGRLVGIM